MDDGDDPPTSDATVDERPQSGRTRDSRSSRPKITGDRYKIGERIGRGGMGEVLAARDEQIGREVAIKRIRTDQPSERAIKRFLREARIQGRLEHPAIPPVHELGRDTDGMPFFAMKKLAGTTLSAILDQRAPATHTRERLLRAYADVCLAVEFAHVNGVIHRDLKPENIMLGDFGEVYVLDWGVAKVIGQDDDFDDIKSDDLQTRTGTAIGTLGYMSPEQAMGDTDIDARSDVYALGIVLGKILDADPDPPPELLALRDRATVESRQDRVQTARLLADTAQRFLDGDRDLALRRKLAKEHLAVAQEVLTGRESLAARSKAMAQAGRALVLDPDLAEAGQLITKLVVEPPTDTPPEVENELRADADQHARAIFRGGAWSCLGYLALVPGLIQTGSAIYFTVAAVIMSLVALFTVLGARGVGTPWVHLLANVAIIVLIARLYSPMFAAPGVAVSLAAGISGDPRLRGAMASVTVWLVMGGAVLAPFAAEQLGWLPATVTYNATDGSLLIHGDAMRGYLPFTALMLLYVCGVTGIAVLVGHIAREGATAMRKAFRVQAWQVRQLMPDMQKR